MTTQEFINFFEPHDDRGNLVPVTGPGGIGLRGEHLNYVVSPGQAPGEPIEPVVLKADVEPGGKLYGKLRRAPAVNLDDLGKVDLRFPRQVDYGKVIYDDPRINYMNTIRAIQSQAVSPEVRQIAATLSQALVTPGSVESSIHPVSHAQDLRLPDASGQFVPICNCKVEVAAVLLVIDSAKASNTEVELYLMRGMQTYVAILTSDELSSIARSIKKRCPWFSLNSSTSGAERILEEYVRNQLDRVQTVTVVRSSGWICVNGNHVFAHAGLPSTGTLRIECSSAVLVDATLSRQDAFRSALDILGCGKLHVTLPLVLTAYAGVLSRLFEEAGFTPRFATFLHGTTGSLKTATAEVIANFYGDRDFSSFRDTPAAIDIAIAEHRDRLLLVDDFQPAATSAGATAARNVLEHLIRLYGDNIAKKRSNSTATKACGEKPNGTCLVTGEFVAGSHSSLLRCLLVPVARGDIDGALLRRYQDNPALWTTNYVGFLQWVGENWGALCGLIRETFPSLRQQMSDAAPEPRLADTGAVLALTAEVLLRYGAFLGVLSHKDTNCLHASWHSTITDLLVGSTQLASGENIAQVCVDAIRSGIVDGTLSIAKSVDDYMRGQDGFCHGKRMFIIPTSFRAAVHRFCSATGRRVDFPPDAIYTQLLDAGLIVPDNESGKRSFLKKTPTIPALNRRERWLSFITDKVFHD